MRRGWIGSRPVVDGRGGVEERRRAWTNGPLPGPSRVRKIPSMTPMSTTDGINAGPEVVIPIVVAAVLLVLLAIPLRGFLVAAVDELAELYRTYGHVALNKALDRRPGLPRTPWFCIQCSSHNTVAARACYRCGGRREACEAPVPDAEAPAGASAGLTTRTRNRTGSGTTTGTGIGTDEG